MRRLKIFAVSLFLLSILASTYLKAQTIPENLTLSGKVADNTGKPLALATVVLTSVMDTTLVRNSVSNENGLYTFHFLPAGDFIVHVSFTGYSTLQSSVVHLAKSTDSIYLPVLALQPGTAALKDVNITASTQVIEHRAGKTVVHIDKSPLAMGNNAMEILERIPGVSIDQDKHILLNGKQDVVVMINDKPTYLSAGQLASLLSATDGGKISLIETMSNPSSRYDASGSAGLINIKLKKAKGQGLKGDFTAGIGYGRAGSENSGLNLDFGHGKLSMFGSLSHRDSKDISHISLNRKIHNLNEVTEFDQMTDIQSLNHKTNLRMGADYDISPGNTLGIGFSGYLNGSHSVLSNITTIGKPGAQADSLLRSLTNTLSSFQNASFNLNDRLKLDKKGQAISIDLDYSHINNTADIGDTSRFFLKDGTLLHEPQVLTSQTPAFLRIYAGTADYVNPINKTIELSAGLKMSKVSTDNNLLAQVLLDHMFINDSKRTNHFLYRESVYAGYFSLKGSIGRLDYQTGLRYELARTTGSLVGSTTTVKKYGDIFPSIAVSRTLGTGNNLSISYSRRIDRPNYDILNPFKYVLDPYTADIGNAFLTPQYTNAFELGYASDQLLYLTFAYSRTAQAITSIVFTEGNQSLQTKRNLDQLSSMNIEANVPYRISKWWNGNVDVNGFYRRYKSDTLASNSIRSGKPAFAVKTSQFLQIGTYKSEILMNYKSRTTSGIFVYRSQWYADLAISRPVLSRKATLGLSITDIFRTHFISDESHLLKNDFTFDYRYDSRIFKLNFNYRFGNDKLRKHQPRNGAEAESGRVKQNS
jgi:iron complex outermembrane receptor protein